ncbi:hypothetical protein ASPNIDRAFT_193061, partial [Aspergillus niger ATCC 1015]
MLGELPGEVLQCVADCLNTAKDRNNLAKTSRRLYRCTNPLLYQWDMYYRMGYAIKWAAENERETTARLSL